MTDRGWATLRRRTTWPLVAGDVLSFVFFSALGHRSHDESNSLFSVLGTAAPFVVGWLAIAPWAGAFGAPSERLVGDVLRRSAIAWLLAWPVCLLLRALALRRGIPASFALVALTANALLLLSWRSMFALYRRRKAMQC